MLFKSNKTIDLYGVYATKLVRYTVIQKLDEMIRYLLQSLLCHLLFTIVWTSKCWMAFEWLIEYNNLKIFVVLLRCDSISEKLFNYVMFQFIWVFTHIKVFVWTKYSVETEVRVFMPHINYQTLPFVSAFNLFSELFLIERPALLAYQ